MTVALDSPDNVVTLKMSQLLRKNLVGNAAQAGLWHHSRRHEAPSLNTLTIVVMVFQLRVVTGTPKIRSIIPK